MRDVVVALIPSSLILLLREFGSSKSGAGVLSDGTTTFLSAVIGPHSTKVKNNVGIQNST